MLLFFLAFLAVLFYGAKTKPRLAFDETGFSRARTLAVNGFFVLLVFLSHVVTYVASAGALDRAYLFVKGQLDQLVVAPFLFFSGYGILCSIRDRGRDYVLHLPKNRILKVLLQAEAAVLLFLLTDLCIGKHYPLRRVLLSLTFWESIGNSNWYVFVVLALYVCVFAAFLIARQRLLFGTALTTAFAAAVVLALRFSGKDPWWYNTLLLFPLGMCFALLKPRLDRVVFQSTPRTAAAFVGALGCFAALHFLRGKGFVFYELWAAAFVCCLVAVMTRVRFFNRLLSFFGRHVFSIFLLQRIPMLVFTRFGLQEHRYVFVLLCFAVTIALAAAFDRALSLLPLFRPRRDASVDNP